MEHSGSASSSVAGTSGRSVAFEIDLNEAPLPSPREIVGGGVFAAEHRCGSCGELEGAMVICGDCGRRFHVECLGVREEQREWKCFECLIECRSGRRISLTAGGGCGSGLFDMNSSPPKEADGVEEDYFVNSELVLAASFPNPKYVDNFHIFFMRKVLYSNKMLDRRCFVDICSHNRCLFIGFMSWMINNFAVNGRKMSLLILQVI